MHLLLTSVKFAEPVSANRAMLHRLAIKEMHCFNVNLAATSDGHIESDSHCQNDVLTPIPFGTIEFPPSPSEYEVQKVARPQQIKSARSD